MSNNYFVCWWNLENLFDSARSPRRSSKLKRALGKSINQWTTRLRDKKISQLVKVISYLNNGAGPDLLGVCEVENSYVIKRLVDALNGQLHKRNYTYIHYDSKDKRGIDIAFIYEGTKFITSNDQVFQHSVMRRTATRDILQANFTTKPLGRKLIVFANHWPARSGGVLKSSGYRQIAGETLAYFHQRAIEIQGKKTAVLVMGDFNDEPFDTSLVDHALSTRDRTKVLRASTPRVLNLMWPKLSHSQGTYYFDNFPYMLDQFLVNHYMLNPSSVLKIDINSIAIENTCPGFIDENSAYPQPLRFGGLGKSVNTEGFSDHFPISVIIEESD
ncbi:endonuclease/exonuclease/phosphatase family protein [Thalassotalea atypica]|uniref:endonuclease/exonuclease/phosphatase family protein n=1 Tax=Thalassotalea atypica TaxID=2054316 RepID=UPI002572C307|nr:endonuclease/exonuclease/phosphatase family protein [Thalassotalea atypica]